MPRRRHCGGGRLRRRATFGPKFGGGLPGLPSTLPASPEHLLTPPRPCWPIEPPHAHGRSALPAGPSRPVGEPSRPSSGPRPSSTVPDTIPPLTSGTLIYFPALPLPPLPFHTRAALPRRILAGYFFCKSFPPAHTIRHPTPRQARTTTPGRRKHTQTHKQTNKRLRRPFHYNMD